MEPRQSLRAKILATSAPTESGCWEWRLGRDRYGYGRLKVGGRMKIAHPLAYEVLVGEIPSGMVVDHKCRNRGCVNPAHLRLLTPGENTLIGTSFSAENRRKTRCPSGHPYHGTNTIRVNGNGRACRACRRIHAANLKARRRAAASAGVSS